MARRGPQQVRSTFGPPTQAVERIVTGLPQPPLLHWFGGTNDENGQEWAGKPLTYFCCRIFHRKRKQDGRKPDGNQNRWVYENEQIRTGINGNEREPKTYTGITCYNLQSYKILGMSLYRYTLHTCCCIAGIGIRQSRKGKAARQINQINNIDT